MARRPKEKRNVVSAKLPQSSLVQLRAYCAREHLSVAAYIEHLITEQFSPSVDTDHWRRLAEDETGSALEIIIGDLHIYISPENAALLEGSWHLDNGQPTRNVRNEQGHHKQTLDVAVTGYYGHDVQFLNGDKTNYCRSNLLIWKEATPCPDHVTNTAPPPAPKEAVNW